MDNQTGNGQNFFGVVTGEMTHWDLLNVDDLLQSRRRNNDNSETLTVFQQSSLQVFEQGECPEMSW